MPPWLPEHGFGEFAGENRLTAIQIEQIRQWVSAGAPEGVLSDSPSAPAYTPGWQLGTPDLILTVPKPFRVPAEGPDIFWNFVLSPAVTQTRFVKSIEVRPGTAQNVHHANVLVDRTRSVRDREKDLSEGFPGMDLDIETPGFDPDSHFLFWKPGALPWVEPAGMAWRLDPGSDLILNVHFHPTGKVELVQPSLGLYFTDKPATQFPMLLQIERDSALNIPPGVKNFLISDDFQLPVDVTAVAVYPHAHYLGSLLDAYATLPDGSRRPLIRIPQWDTRWQAVYHYSQPMFLPRGTVISMRFHYDNSAGNPRNPSVPPRRVTVGNQSTDEMGHLWLQVLTRDGGAGTEREILQESLMRHRLENDPSNGAAHLSLGSLLLNRQEYEVAVPHFRDSLRLNPDQPMTLNNLGVALQSQGKLTEALEQFQHALVIRPAYRNARFNLANALAAQRKWPEAAASYRQILSSDPADAGARNQLVAVLVQMGDSAASQGRLNDAAACYRELVAEQPSNADLRNNFGIILARSGDLTTAAAQFEAALQISPSHAVARRNLEAVRQALIKR